MEAEFPAMFIPAAPSAPDFCNSAMLRDSASSSAMGSARSAELCRARSIDDERYWAGRDPGCESGTGMAPVISTPGSDVLDALLDTE
jgi:hypothetical protein